MGSAYDARATHRRSPLARHAHSHVRTPRSLVLRSSPRSFEEILPHGEVLRKRETACHSVFQTPRIYTKLRRL